VLLGSCKQQWPNSSGSCKQLPSNSFPPAAITLPISEHASDVVRILRVNFDAIFLEGADVEKTLKAANKEVNALFE
jgi:hypothetical protein